jgi:hypothetical protein
MSSTDFGARTLGTSVSAFVRPHAIFFATAESGNITGFSFTPQSVNCMSDDASQHDTPLTAQQQRPVIENRWLINLKT